MKTVAWIVIGIVLGVIGSMLFAEQAAIAHRSSLRKYARLISTPAVVDPNSAKYYKQESRQWRIAAEHYGGICKWFSENHDIADNVTLGNNAVLSYCLVVSDGWVEINGESATVMNCEFRSWDMNWVKSLEGVDPNEPLQKGE